MARLNILDLQETRLGDNEVSSKFLQDVKDAISKYDYVNRHMPSKTYKPSCLGCSRMMYYMRKGYEQDDKISEYQGIGMADTGTRRHVAIQEVLEHMSELGFPWKYLDVGEYLEEKHRNGELLDTKVTDYRGHECHLMNEDLHISCMCDGILRNTETDEDYLFEFKNQISFKAQLRDEIDKSHYNQIIAYSTLLGLDKVLMLYENRDTCELKAPPVYAVTEKDKEDFIATIKRTESLVIEGIVPAAQKNSGMCKWCNYSTQCKKDGSAMKL